MLYMTPRIEHKFIDGVENKRCCSCKLYSPLSNYNKSSKTWDKLRPTCKICLSKESLEALNYDSFNFKLSLKRRDTRITCL